MRRLIARRGRHERGQSLVEMALILPLLLLLVLGTLEFGFIFDHHLSLEYATREGARVGSALANGGGPMGCGSGQSPNAADVDPAIVAAVQRVLTSPGSPIAPRIDQVTEIQIYRAGVDGQVLGSANRWAPGAGPSVDGLPLQFVEMSGSAWPACSRDNGSTPDSIGVSLSYTYDYQTPLAQVLGITLLQMDDRTVMQLNPTNN